MGGGGQGRADRLSKAYTNTGSTTAVWEVLHHHCKGFLPLSQVSVFEGPPRVFVTVSSWISKHLIYGAI